MLLDAVLADAEIGQLEQRIAGQLLLRDGGDIAEHMGRLVGRRDSARLWPTSMVTPGRSGALTSIRATSSQLRFSRTVTGTKLRLRSISRMMRRRSRSR